MPAWANRVSDAATAHALVIAPAVIVAMAVPIAVVAATTVPIAVRAFTIAACVVPFAVAMVLFPLASFPVAVAVVITLAVPARTHHDHRLSGRVDRRRGIDRRRGVGRAWNADVHAYIDVCQRDRRCADPQTCNDSHGQPAAS
jgi:hypothetical protein